MSDDVDSFIDRRRAHARPRRHRFHQVL